MTERLVLHRIRAILLRSGSSYRKEVVKDGSLSQMSIVHCAKCKKLQQSLASLTHGLRSFRLGVAPFGATIKRWRTVLR